MTAERQGLEIELQGLDEEELAEQKMFEREFPIEEKKEIEPLSQGHDDDKAEENKKIVSAYEGPHSSDEEKAKDDKNKKKKGKCVIF